MRPVLEPGFVIAGRYTLRHEIGRGGMGSVWEAEDRTLERNVAVKTMVASVATDQTLMARFTREARAIAKLRSPHIVEIHDFGIDPFPFMVMERMNGEDLKARLKGRRTLSYEKACDVIEQAAKGLSVAHQQGVIHRDLKPGNIFLLPQDDDELVKVFDFGIAHAMGTSDKRSRRLTEQGTILGTPAYMSPEQLRATDTDQRADVWALCVIAYRCLVGRQPFPGKAMPEMVRNILAGDYRSPSTVDAGMAPALDAFFARAFAVELEQRFPTVRAAAVELRRLLVGRTPSLQSMPAVAPAPESATTVDESGLTTVRMDSKPAMPVEIATRGEETTSLTLKQAGTWESGEFRSRRGVVAAAIGGAVLVSVVGWLALRSPEQGDSGVSAAPADGAESANAQLDEPPEDEPAEETVEDVPVEAPVEPAPSASASAATSAPAARARPLPRPGPRRPPAKAKKKSGDDLFDGVF